MAAGAVRAAARIAQRPSFEGPVSSPATEQDLAQNANSVINGIRSARGNRAGVVPADLRQAPAANSGTSQNLDPVMAHNVVQGLLSEILNELKAQRSATDLIANSPALSKLADGSAMGTQELREAAEQLRTVSASTPAPAPAAPAPEADTTVSAASESEATKASAKDTARVADAVEKMDARDAQAADEAASERERQRQREARLESREARYREQDKRDEERSKGDGEEKQGFLKKILTGDLAGARGDIIGAALSTVGLEDFSDQLDELIQSRAEKDDDSDSKKPGFFARLMQESEGAGAPQLPAPETPRRSAADTSFDSTPRLAGPESDTDSEVVTQSRPSPASTPSTLTSNMDTPTLSGGVGEPESGVDPFAGRDAGTASGALNNLTVTANNVTLNGKALTGGVGASATAGVQNLGKAASDKVRGAADRVKGTVTGLAGKLTPKNALTELKTSANGVASGITKKLGTVRSMSGQLVTKGKSAAESARTSLVSHAQGMVTGVSDKVGAAKTLTDQLYSQTRDRAQAFGTGLRDRVQGMTGMMPGMPGMKLRPALGGPARRVGKYGAVPRKPMRTGDKKQDRINKIEFFVMKQEQKVLRRLMKTLERVENALPKGGLMGSLLGRTKLGRLLGYGDALGGFDGWGSDRGRGRNNRRPGARGGRVRQVMSTAMKGLRGIIGGTVAAVSGAASRVGGALGMGGGRRGPGRPRGRGIGGRIAGMLGRGAGAATAMGGSLLGMSALGGLGGFGGPELPPALPTGTPGTKPALPGRTASTSGRLASRVATAAPGVAAAGKVAGSAAGAIGRGALKAARFIPGIGQALTAGMAVYDGFKGWGRAGQNFGLAEGQEATTGQKISSSVGGILSGLSFGLLDEGSVARGVHGLGSGIGSVASKVMEYSPLGLAAKGFKSLFGSDDDEDKKKGSDAVKGASVRSTGHIGEGIGLPSDGEGKPEKPSATSSILDKAKSLAALTPVGFMAKTMTDLVTGDGNKDAVNGAAIGSTGAIAGAGALAAEDKDKGFSSTGNDYIDKRVAKARAQADAMKERYAQSQKSPKERAQSATVAPEDDGFRSTGNPVIDRRVQRARARMEAMKARRDQMVANGQGTVSTETTTDGDGTSGTQTTTIRTSGHIGPSLDLSADGTTGSGNKLASLGKAALESTPVGMVTAQVAKALGLDMGAKSLADRAKATAGGVVDAARGALGSAAEPAGNLLTKLSSFSPLAMVPGTLSKLFGGDDAPEGKGRAVSGSVRTTGALFGDMVPGADGKAQPGRTLTSRATGLGMASGTASDKAVNAGDRFGNLNNLLVQTSRMMGLGSVVQSSLPDLSSFFPSDGAKGSATVGSVTRGAAVTSSHTLDTDVKLPPAIQDQVLQNDTVLSKVANGMTGRGAATASNPLSARPGETASAKRAFNARPSRPPAGGQNRTRGGGASSFHVDDYGIAVMNSILFD